MTVLLTLAFAGPGCQDPTQVTLDLSLDKKAKCEEITVGGTAITVGVEPRATEEEVTSGFVSAKTNACDGATNKIGTLIITPSDSGKAAVIVVVGYKGKDPTTCRSPLYEGCIVARRRFVFAEHTRLRMPINIDPDCANVPCDAFSTCNRGTCVSSETKCSDSECETPGTLPDGGLDEGSIVLDANPAPPDAPASTDGGLEDGSGGDGDAGLNGSSCNGTNLLCGNTGGTCIGPSSCCSGVCGPQNSCAPNTQLCCMSGTTPECPATHRCERSASAQASGTPGVCVPTTTNPPSCNATDDVVCGQPCVQGSPSPVCCASSAQMCSPTCAPLDQLCCLTTQCPQPNHACVGRNGATPGRCQLVVQPLNDGGYPTCFGDILHCLPNNDCNQGTDACCQTGGMIPVCNQNAGTCSGFNRYCCGPEDCDLKDGGRKGCIFTGPPPAAGQCSP